jgi:hypothetical protein
MDGARHPISIKAKTNAGMPMADAEGFGFAWTVFIRLNGGAGENGTIIDRSGLAHSKYKDISRSHAAKINRITKPR